MITASQPDLEEIEKQSMFDTNFDKLYDKLKNDKDIMVQHYVKRTKEIQRASKLKNLRNSMDDVIDHSEDDLIQIYKMINTPEPSPDKRNRHEFKIDDLSTSAEPSKRTLDYSGLPAASKTKEERLRQMLNAERMNEYQASQTPTYSTL